MKKLLLCGVLAGTLGLPARFSALCPAQNAPAASSSITVLTRDEASKILPPSVFYRGQTAPVQARNSAGLKLPGGKLVLVALVDNSGYSTGIAERYQGVLITEVPLRLRDRTLPPGEYGFGFLSGRVVVMDVGANEVLSTATTVDSTMKRPNPLQIVNAGGQDRLYLGRSYVVLQPAP